MKKSTGLVRRIDDLGRTIIPKEVRRLMGIKDGDAFEIFIDKASNEVIFRKYEVKMDD